MTESTARLNAVTKLLVDFATKNGINLQTEFGTVAEFKKFVIAISFKTLVDAGTPANVAYDAIFGNGEYEKLAATVWESFQAA